MRRVFLSFIALVLPAVASAHDTGVEALYAGAELLLLIVMPVIIVALRAPWRRQLMAVLVLMAATAAAIALGHIPTDSAGDWLEPTVFGCIPLGSICALLLATRRGPRRARR